MVSGSQHQAANNDGHEERGEREIHSYVLGVSNSSRIFFRFLFAFFPALSSNRKISIMKLKFASRKQRPQSAFKCHSRHSTKIDSFVLVSGCF